MTLFYKNQMSTAYKTDEKVIRDIISRHVKPKDGVKLDLIIYYKSLKVSNLLIQNNRFGKPDKLKCTNVVYQYTCEGCKLHPTHYIGVTTTTLSRRLTMHLREGAPAKHAADVHNDRLTRRQLVDNTLILRTAHDTRRLHVYEAMYIRERSPALNKQLKSCVTLELWDNRAT